jgi:hypothetical protein
MLTPGTQVRNKTGAAADGEMKRASRMLVCLLEGTWRGWSNRTNSLCVRGILKLIVIVECPEKGYLSRRRRVGSRRTAHTRLIRSPTRKVPKHQHDYRHPLQFRLLTESAVSKATRRRPFNSRQSTTSLAVEHVRKRYQGPDPCDRVHL